MTTYKTRNGQAIEPYIAQAPAFATAKIERGNRYRLCQILPAMPQRLEWIREDNIKAITA